MTAPLPPDNRVLLSALAAKSEQTLFSLLSNLPGMVYRCRNDRDWTIEFVSQGSFDLTGYRPEDLQSGRLWTFGDLTDPAYRPAVLNDIRASLEQRLPFRLVYPILTRGGERKWVWEQGSGVFSEDGDLLYIQGFVADITERRKIEEELQEKTNLLLDRERQQSALTDNVPVLIARVNVERRYVFANRAYRDLLGIPPDQVIGRTMSETLGPAAYASIESYVTRVLAGEKVTYEAALDYRNVGPRFVNVSYVPEWDSAGAVSGFVLSAMDFTARRAAEEALRESEQRFKSLFENGVNSSICLDRSGCIAAVNPPTAALVGFTQEELVGNTQFPFVLPEDVPEVREILAETLGGHNRQYELHYRHKNGHSILVSGWSVPVMVNGDCTGMYLLARDITAERQAQEAARRLALIVENSHEAIISTGVDGTIQSWNGGAECLYGYVAAEVLGLSVILLLRPEGAGEELSSLLRRLERGGRVRDLEMIHVDKDGNQRTVSLTTSPVQDADGSVVGHASIVRDITAHKEFEAEREALLVEAVERADRCQLTGLLNHRAFHKRLEEEADHAQRKGTSLAVAMLDLNNFKFFNDAYGHQTGDEVLRWVAAALHGCCRDDDCLARFGGDEFACLMPNVTADSAALMVSRLRASIERLGYRPPGHDSDIPLGLSVGVALFPSEASRQDLIALADERLYRAKTGGDGDQAADRLRATMADSVEGFSMLDALVTAVDNKDRYTRRHSEDVMGYSLIAARGLGLSAQEQHSVAVAALLHDVGKIGVPDSILRKPARLTEEEFGAIQQHPTMGAVIVGAVPGLEGTLDAVRYHHERWDGGGYPSGLRGEDIPLSARLMAVADAFSAMTMDRPYRMGLGCDTARAVLKAGAGTQWDPRCVEAFLREHASGCVPGAPTPSEPRSTQEAVR